MILLVSATDKIQIVTTDATTTIDVRAEAMDAPNPIPSGATQTPYNKGTGVVGITAGTDIVAAPGAATVRNVKRISVANTHATLPQSFRLTITNAGGTVDLIPLTTIQARERMIITDDGIPKVFDASGKLKVSGFATAAGVSGDVQYNDGAGNLAGAADVEIHDGDLALVANATPTAPLAGRTKLFGRSIASRILPAFVGPEGLDSSLQPMLARNKIGYWCPPGNATTVPGVLGFTALTAIGTATARNVATTNMATRMRRLGYVSAATAAALAGGRMAVAQFTIGDGGSPALGGFFMTCRFVPSDAAAVAGKRMFVGMINATGAPTNVEPSTLTNCVGVAQLSTSSNLHIVYGGSAAQAPIDLGVNFPAAGLSADAYDLTVFAAPTGALYYSVTRINTGNVAEGQLTGVSGVAIPAATTLLGFSAWVCNNATLLACAIDLCSIYIETDT